MIEYDMRCTCGTHRVTFAYDKDDDEFYTLLWYLAGVSFSFLDRLKLAWKVITQGDALVYDVVIRGPELRSFLKYLTKCQEIQNSLNKLK